MAYIACDVDHHGNRKTGHGIYKDTLVGQQFTSPNDCEFNRCYIRHGAWSWHPGDPHEIVLRLKICLDSGDKPFTVLATSDISCAGLEEGQHYGFTYSFDTIQIASGQKAWVVVMFEPFPDQWWPDTNWRADDSDAVSAGIVRRSLDGGVTWTEDPIANYPPKCNDFRLYYAGVPTVVTKPATDIEEETATLNGEITAVGEENADERGFDWGLDTSYGNSWTESDSYGVAAFSHAIGGLSPGTTIHFRAKAHNPGGWDYGSDLIFVTKPQACTNMAATTISGSQINVSWTKGDGAVNTVVRRKPGAYPATVADGIEAYNGPLSSFSDKRLSPTTAYYYRGWSYTSPHYADDYCQDNATTTPSAIPPADPTIAPKRVTLELIRNIEMMNTGRFYIDKSGNAVYESRFAR